MFNAVKNDEPKLVGFLEMPELFLTAFLYLKPGQHSSMLRFVRAGIYVIVRCGAAVFIDEIYIHIKQTKEDFMTKSNKGAAALIIAASLILHGCFFLDEITAPEATPSKSYSAGDVLNGKTIVWVNTGAGRWRFLAMGTPSNPMPWDLDTSRFISTKSLSSKIGDGKENSIFLKREFESGGSNMRTAQNNAVMYCISRGGWLPSRDEAEKIAQFTSTDFWTSHCDASSSAFYYSPLQQSLQSKFRNNRDSIVAIPVYYLDAQGNITEP